MNKNRRSNAPVEINIRDLEVELYNRKSQTAADKSRQPSHSIFSYFTTRQLERKYRKMTAKRERRKRGNWYRDKRVEANRIRNKWVRRNAQSVVAVGHRNNFLDTGDGYWELKTKPFGEKYYLRSDERFFNQPAAVSSMFNGVLVAPDVVATAAHAVYQNRLKHIVFVFGYMYDAQGIPVTRFPRENVYRGVEILQREYDVDGPRSSGLDFALVRLDRPVTGQHIAILSNQTIETGQKIYALGHACGLPMLYAPGGIVRHVKETYLAGELDLYSGNSGSPVFSVSHHLIGIVAGADPKDFEGVPGNCVAMVYPNKSIESHAARIVKASKFEVLK